MNRVPLNLPQFNLDIRIKDGNEYVFDILRKKEILLTPEEWVRQNVLHFFIENKKYPKNLIKCEGGLSYNKQQKRSDIICYNSQGEALVLVECKAPSVKLKQNVFDQAAMYNTKIKAPYLVISNGLMHLVCKIDHEKGDYTILDDLPAYTALI